MVRQKQLHNSGGASATTRSEQPHLHTTLNQVQLAHFRADVVRELSGGLHALQQLLAVGTHEL